MCRRGRFGCEWTKPRTWLIQRSAHLVQSGEIGDVTHRVSSSSQLLVGPSKPCLFTTEMRNTGKKETKKNLTHQWREQIPPLDFSFTFCVDSFLLCVTYNFAPYYLLLSILSTISVITWRLVHYRMVNPFCALALFKNDESHIYSLHFAKCV